MRDGDVAAQLAALPHRRYRPVGKAGHHRALRRGDVQPVVKAADALQRIGAEAEAGGQLPLYRRSIGEAQYLLEQLRIGGLRLRRADGGCGRRRRRHLLRAEHRSIGIGQRAADGALLREGAARSGEHLHKVGIGPQQIQHPCAIAVQHVGHQQLDGDSHHQQDTADQQLYHAALLLRRCRFPGCGLARSRARRLRRTAAAVCCGADTGAVGRAAGRRPALRRRGTLCHTDTPPFRHSVCAPVRH